MAKYKSEVVLTCNGQQVEDVLKTLRQMAADVKKEMDSLDPNVDVAKINELKKKFDLLNSAEADTIEANERLQHAIDNLASTSLQNLKKALGDGRRELQGLSEDQLAEADEIRKKMKIVGDEVRLLEGQYVKIEEGIGELDKQSDQWLSKAITQQKDLVASLRKDNSEYEIQLNLLKQLQAEDEVRAGKRSTLTKDQAKHRLENVGDFTEAQVKEAIAVMKKLRDEVELGDEEWDEYAKSIDRAEKEMQRMKDNYKFMEKDRAMEVLKHPGWNREEYVQQAIDSLEELKKHVDVGSEDWHEYENAIQNAKQKLTELKSTVDVLSKDEALEVARTGQYTRHKIGEEDVAKDASFNQMQQSKKLLTDARNNATDIESIKQYNEALAQLDKRMDSIVGKKKSVEGYTTSWQRMKEILNDSTNAPGRDIENTVKHMEDFVKRLPAGSDGAKQLRTRIAELKKEMQQVATAAVNVDDVIKRSRKGQASIGELKQAYKQLEEKLDDINYKSKEYYKHVDKMNALRSKIDGVTNSVKGQGGAWSTALRNLTAYFGLMQLFSKIQSMITGVISANFKLSDQLADIRKVSGLLSQDIDKMAVSLSKIDTRTTVEELNRIAYAGSKLGIGEYGIEALEGFVRASNQVNVALKEDLGEEALTALSKITQVMGLIPQMGVEQSMLKTGSAIFKLASTSTATSPKIIDFANRMLSLGKNAALGTADILALGAAVDSMALEPEVASTAFGKLVTEIRKGTTSIEKDLGLAKGSLKEMVETGHGMDAIITIFQKMHETGNVFALDGLFKDLGSDGARLVKTMVTMADKVDMLRTAVDTSNEAFKYGSAITTEYNIQQQTAQGILERANNLWHKSFVNPDGVNSVKQMAIAWYDFSRAITQSSVAQQGFMVSLKMLIASVEALIKILPAITGFFIGKGIQMAAVGLYNAGKAVLALRNGFAALNVVMKANVFGIIISAAAMIYTWFRKDAVAAEDAAKANTKFKKSMEDVWKEVGEAKTELENYKTAIDKAKVGTKERATLIEQFNKKFGSYLTNLLTEKSTAEDLAKAYNEAANAIERKVFAQNKEKDIEQHVAPRAGREAQLLYNYGQEAKKHDSAYGSAWLEDFADTNLNKKGFSATLDELISRSGVGKQYNEQYRAALIQAIKNTNGAPVEKFDWEYVNSNGSRAKVSSTMKEDEKMVAMAVAYLRQRRYREILQKEVNEKYKPYEDKFVVEDVQGVPVGDNNDNNKNKDKTNNDNKIAKDRANALLANIQAFYEEQYRKFLEWVAKMNENGEKVSEGYIKDYRERLEMHRKEAEGLARQSIATAGKEWDEFKGQLVEDQFQTATETDKRLLAAIEQSDVKELHDLFEKLGANLSKENNKTLSENLGALLDEIFKNGAKNLREAAERLVKRQQEIQKILNEHDYTGTVDRNTRSKFDELRFIRPAQGVDKDTAEGQEKMAQAFDKLTKKARESIVELYKIDPATKDFQQKMLDFLAVANDGFDFSIYKEKGHVQELKALYQELIKYSDLYTEAMNRKLAYQKKLIDIRYERDEDNLRLRQSQAVLDMQSSLFGKQTNMAANLGFADASWDPEVESMKLKMEMAENYYNFMKKHGAAQELLDDQERVRQQAQLDYMKAMAKAMQERISQLQSFVSPVVDFGAAVGDALGRMRDDAESAQEAIKNALKSMIKTMGESMIKAQFQQMTQEMQKANTLRIAAREQAKNEQKQKAEAKGLKFDPKDKETKAAIKVRQKELLKDPKQIKFAPDTPKGTAADPLFVKVVNAGDINGSGTATVDDASSSGAISDTSDSGVIVANKSGDTNATQNASSDGTLATDTHSAASNGMGAQMGAELGGQAGSALVDGMANGDMGGAMGQLGASAIMQGAQAGMNAEFRVKKKDKDGDAVKAAKKEAKELEQIKRQSARTQENIETKNQQTLSGAVEDGGEDRVHVTETVGNATNSALEAAGNVQLTTQQATDQAALTEQGATVQGETTLSIAGAMAKCFEFLGPIGGPIAAAAVQATLMGLLNWALSAALGGGSGSKTETPKTNTKIVSGMLTYDSGNVRDLKPFFDKDGNMYWAEDDSDQTHQGVNLLTTPTATTINGERSLVAEQGPELVVGRETTAAMMQNNPALLRALYEYDKHHSGRTAYDRGNISEQLASLSSAVAPGTSGDGMTTALADATASNVALLAAVNALLARLNEPINAKIDMYGRGNLYDSMTKANQFMKGKS